jgi:tetratricopeptide (TPR) repeat protein
MHLIDLLCRFYQLSGVVARDQMNISRALSDGKKSIELAFSIENAELIAASLLRRAKTRLKQAQYDAALQELEAALVYAQRSRDPLKGYIHQAMAEAYTMIADPHDQHMQQKSLTLLDRVSTIAENGHLEDDGSFVKLNIAGLSMDRATVLTHFLQPEEARQSLLMAQHHLKTDLNRWRSRLLIANAETSLAENDAQSCCEFLIEALNIVQETHSRSNEKRVTTVYQRLSTIAPHSSLVRQVGEQLRAL